MATYGIYTQLAFRTRKEADEVLGVHEPIEEAQLNEDLTHNEERDVGYDGDDDAGDEDDDDDEAAAAPAGDQEIQSNVDFSVDERSIRKKALRKAKKARQHARKAMLSGRALIPTRCLGDVEQNATRMEHLRELINSTNPSPLKSEWKLVRSEVHRLLHIDELGIREDYAKGLKDEHQTKHLLPIIRHQKICLPLYLYHAIADVSSPRLELEKDVTEQYEKKVKRLRFYANRAAQILKPQWFKEYEAEIEESKQKKLEKKARKAEKTKQKKMNH